MSAALNPSEKGFYFMPVGMTPKEQQEAVEAGTKKWMDEQAALPLNSDYGFTMRCQGWRTDTHGTVFDQEIKGNVFRTSGAATS